MQDSAPSHHAIATKNFLRDYMPDFISSQERTPHSPDLNPLDYSVWDILQELVYKPWTICESQRSLSECYQKQMAWCWWPDSQKSYIAVEKAFSSCGKAEWRTYSAHFLLINWLMQITVTFWCNPRTTNNINDQMLAYVVLWHAILFRLYHG